MKENKVVDEYTDPAIVAEHPSNPKVVILMGFNLKSVEIIV